MPAAGGSNRAEATVQQSTTQTRRRTMRSGKSERFIPQDCPGRVKKTSSPGDSCCPFPLGGPQYPGRPTPPHSIGAVLQRREGLAKLSGRERYVDDLPLEGFLWGMTVRSPAPRGRVTAVRFARDVDWSRFVVVDHRDLPGPNVVYLI